MGKTTRIPVYTLLKALSRRIDGGSFRDKFAGTFLADWGRPVPLGNVTENRFFSFLKGALKLTVFDTSGRTNLGKILATFEKTKNNRGTEESYDAIINAFAYDPAIVEVLQDMALHAVFLLSIDRRLHELAHDPRKVLEEARLLDVVMERLEAAVDHPELCYDPKSLVESLARSHVLERSFGLFEKLDTFPYPSRNYAQLSNDLQRACASLIRRDRAYDVKLSLQLGGFHDSNPAGACNLWALIKSFQDFLASDEPAHRSALVDWPRRAIFDCFSPADLLSAALTCSANLATACAVFLARGGARRSTLDDDPHHDLDESPLQGGLDESPLQAELANAAAAEVRPVHAIIKEAAGVLAPSPRSDGASHGWYPIVER